MLTANDSLCPRCLLSDALENSNPEARDTGFLDSLPIPLDETGSGAPVLPAGSTSAMVGRYKLLEQIGEGGFGVVWMAEQREPIKRRVALKILKLGMDTKQVVARFEAERQALAMMDHPNIAKILDAGATELGRPYFVMELVRGIPITKYCDQEKLHTQARLELFTKVCQAIQHAHQKGIIHRDIKPSNILVTLHDGRPVPKVIDFGIAKATQGDLTDKTMFTAFEQFMGTPAYMSPEQAEMSGLDIDTRSDIYSLGVLLYELLTGQPPFDPARLAKAGMDEVRRTIREVEPARPSTKFAALAADEQTTTAQRRGVDSRELLHQVKGDLDWIAMKCLEKERERRYDTASILAADIKRHLSNEPISARSPSVVYRVQKALRRNKLLFTAVGMIGLALAFGTWAARRVKVETELRKGRDALQSANKLFSEHKNDLAISTLAHALRRLPRNRAIEERLVNELRSRMLFIPSPHKPSDQENIVYGFLLDPENARCRAQEGSWTAHIEDKQTVKASNALSVTSFKVPRGVIRSLAISRDGSKLAAAATSEVFIWNLDSKRELTIVKCSGDVMSIDFGSTSDVIFCGTRHGGVERRTIGGAPGTFDRTSNLHRGKVNVVRVNDTGEFVVSGGDDGTIRAWRAGNLEPLSFPRLVGERLEVDDIRWTAKERRIFVRTSDAANRVLSFWWVPPESPSIADFVPTNNLFPFEISEVLNRPASNFHQAAITFTNISRDKRLLATASTDNSARIWDVSTLKPVGEDLRHDDTVNCVVFSPDGARLVTSTSSWKVRVWDVATSEALTDWLVGLQRISSATFTPDGLHVVAYNQDQSVIWRIHSASGECPSWLPNFAEAASGYQTDEVGRSSHIAHQNGVMNWDSLREAASRFANLGDYP